MSIPLRALFNGLEGRWSLVRTATNGSHLTGSASFTRIDSDSFLYREDGRFSSYNRVIGNAFREYVYKFQDKTIAVYHHGQSSHLLHPLLFDSRHVKYPCSAKAINRCPPDVYTGTYVFESPNKYTLTYVVKGPKKDFTITSTLERST